MRDGPATSFASRRGLASTRPLPQTSDEIRSSSSNNSLSLIPHKQTDDGDRKKQGTPGLQTDSSDSKLSRTPYTNINLFNNRQSSTIRHSYNSTPTDATANIINPKNFKLTRASHQFSASCKDLFRQTSSPFFTRKLNNQKSTVSLEKLVFQKNNLRFRSKSASVNSLTRRIWSSRNFETGQRYRLRKNGNAYDSGLHNSEAILTYLPDRSDVSKSKTRNCYRTIDETKFSLVPDDARRNLETRNSYVSRSGDRRSPASVRFTVEDDVDRRMSAPELPPIVKDVSTKGGKWMTSANSVASTGSKTSVHNSTASASGRTTNHSVKGITPARSVSEPAKEKTPPIHKNHSDPSLRKFLSITSSGSQDSDSAVDNTLSTREKESIGVSDSGESIGSCGGTQRRYKTRGHRAFSWTTDRTCSLGRLDTLTEGTDFSTNVNNAYSKTNAGEDKVNDPGSITAKDEHLIAIKETDFKHNITNNYPIPSKTNLKSRNYDRPSASRPKTALTGIGSRHLRDIKDKSSNRKLETENGHLIRDDSLSDADKMMKSNSEDKLNKKSLQISVGNPAAIQNQKTTQRALSRNLSVDIFDKNSPSSKQRRSNVVTRPLHTSKLRRVSSVSNIYVTDTRTPSNVVRNMNEKLGSDRSIDACDRLIEWLHVVNNIGEYDTDPKDAVFEYSDEPRKTDTAIHLVYQGD